MILARKHGSEPGATFTVRRTTGGYGVEKIFPLYSPMIDNIEIIKRSKTRRSKLYHIRDKALKGVKKRLKMMFVDISTKEAENEIKDEDVKPEEVVVDEVSNNESDQNVETNTETPSEEKVEKEEK